MNRTTEQHPLRKAKTLLALQYLSDFGDQITAALLALSLIEITKSTSKVAFVYCLTTMGFIVFTFIGGYIGDKLSKRKILFCSDLGRGLVVLLMILAVSQKILPLVYITSFFLSLLSSLHTPVKQGLWAQSVPSRHLEKYNSYSELSKHSSTILGPLVASVFVTLSLVTWGLAVDAFTFFVCAIVFLRILAPQSSHVVTPRQSKKSLFLGMKIAATNRELSKYIFYDAMLMLGHGTFNATLVVLLQRDFQWAKAEYSYHLAITAGFAFLGASINQIVRLGVMQKFVICSFVSATSLGMALYFKVFPIFSILYGCCALTSVVASIVARTKIQTIARADYPESISSIMASRLIVIKLMTLLGAGNCIILNNFLSLEMVLFLHTIPMALACLPFVLTLRKDKYVLKHSSTSIAAESPIPRNT